MATAQNNYFYSDVKYTLQSDVTGNPVIVFDTACINQSIYTILSTLKGERIMLPDFGSNIPRFVFEPISIITAKLMQNDIQQAILRWESRVVLTSVDVVPNYQLNEYNINVNYNINGGTSATPGQFNATLPTQGH